MNSNIISKHYIGEKGIEYAKGIQDVGNHLGYKIQSRFFIPYLKKKWNILDFGCANGFISDNLLPFVSSIEGVEVNNYTREIAKQQIKGNIYNSVDEIPEEKKYDAIISNHVLEHIPDIYQTLVKLKKHLKKDGLLIIITPIESLQNKNNRKWKPNNIDNHLFTWTPLLFGNLLVEAGFKPLKFKIITSSWSPKLFFLGDNFLQKTANYLYAIFKRNKQLFTIAENNYLEK